MGRAYGPTGPESRGLGNVMSHEGARTLGKDVYAAAKRLTATRTMAQTSPRSGGTIMETRWGGRLPPGLAPKLAEHHKTDIFAGMVRMRHTYARATQTQYGTWRTISESNPEGWRHPGIEARNIARSVEEWVQRHGPRIAANAIKQVLTGGKR